MLRTRPSAHVDASATISSTSWSPRRIALATLLVCAVYYAGGAVGLLLRVEPRGLTTIWLPHGILVAALLIVPTRHWWVFVAALLPTHVHMTMSLHGQVPPAAMLALFAGNMAQATVAAAALRQILGRPPSLDSLSRMGAFMIGAALLAPGLVLAAVSGVVVAGGWADGFWTMWQQRFLAQMCGAVIIAAPILYLAGGGLTAIRQAERRRVVEFATLTTVLISLLALFGWRAAHLHYQWILFVPLPLLLWSAVRFGPAGLGSHLLAVAVVTLFITKVGRGPFVAGSPTDVALALQGFFLATSIPLMLLAALVRQNVEVTTTLRRSQAQYRSMIEDQTELICRFRPDGTYTFVNGAYARYFKRTPESLIGEKFWQFIPDHQRPISEAFLAALTPEHPSASIEHPVAGPAGEVRWQQWTDRGFFDERGRIVEYQAVGRDITDRKRAEEAVRASENQVRSFVQHSPAAVAMFDRDMRYLVYSNRWLTDYKLVDKEILGRRHYDVFPEIPERWREIHRRCLAGAVETCEDDSFIRQDGSVDWLRWDVRPWRNARGEIGGVIMFTEVITERKRAEEEHLQLLAHKRVSEALQEMDRKKDEFLAMLAHELRNPLAPITLAAEVIRMRNPADDSIVWAHGVIARQSAQLTRLVDDLLDVSRMTLGKIRLNVAPLDLRYVIAQAIEATQPLFTARQHALSIDLPDQTLPVHGDAARLTQIISNLLNNAAKYTIDGGRIAIRAQVVDEQIVVSVADNGAGIPREMLGRVFDLFTQLEPPGDRSPDGLGIGLALVKRLVEMHDGTIEARSEGPERGSELIVRLPRAMDQRASDTSAHDANNGQSDQRSLRILVVDDNVAVAESVSAGFDHHLTKPVEPQVSTDLLRTVSAAN